jgi:hypothetical protein
MVLRGPTVVVAMASLTACMGFGDAIEPPRSDSGVEPVTDAATVEPEADAGLTDAGSLDAGIDAGVVDAGEVDAGLPDAGPFDAGIIAREHEPTGFSPLLDFDYQVLQAGSWVLHSGSATVMTDSAAPWSPPHFARCHFPAGFVGGVACGRWTTVGTNVHRDELYLAFSWRPSDPFDGHISNVNKLIFLLGDTNTGNTIMTMWGAAPPYTLIVTLQHVTCNSHIPNGHGDACGTYHVFPNKADGLVELGKWHRVELYQKMSTNKTSRDGIIRFWLDGELVGENTDANLAAPPGEFQIDPTWGGGENDTKTSSDYHDFDHVYLSAP